MRRELSPTEKLLWKALRDRRFAGFKFRRQQVIGHYIVDFYCSRAALVLELDGETHLGAEARDGERQQWLERQGLKVLRFWNNQVFDEYEAVLEAIWRECDSRCKARPLTPTPSPPEERGRGACDGPPPHPQPPRDGPPPHPQPLSPGGERGDR